MSSFSLDAFDVKQKNSLSQKSASLSSDVNPLKNNPICKMVAQFFLFVDENLAGPESEHMFKTEEDEAGLTAEDHVIEKADAINEFYKNHLDSDDVKSDVRKFIIGFVFFFNSKNEEALGKIYFDEYFDFLRSDDYNN